MPTMLYYPKNPTDSEQEKMKYLVPLVDDFIWEMIGEYKKIAEKRDVFALHDKKRVLQVQWVRFNKEEENKMYDCEYNKLDGKHIPYLSYYNMRQSWKLIATENQSAYRNWVQNEFFKPVCSCNKETCNTCWEGQGYGYDMAGWEREVLSAAVLPKSQKNMKLGTWVKNVLNRKTELSRNMVLFFNAVMCEFHTRWSPWEQEMRLARAILGDKQHHETYLRMSSEIGAMTEKMKKMKKYVRDEYNEEIVDWLLE